MKQYLDKEGLDILWRKILERTQVDSELSSISINPVQNMIVTDALYEVYDSIQAVEDESLDNAFDDYTFPLILTVSDNLIFEKGETVNITIDWSLERNGKSITPDHIYINNVEYPTSSNQIIIDGVNTDIIYIFRAEYKNNTVSKEIPVKFITPSYILNISDDLSLANIDESDILSGTKILLLTKEYTYNTNLDFQKVCYAYPKSYEEITDIIDMNGYNYKYSYDMKEMIVNGIQYYIYTMTDPVTIEGFKQIYK